MLTIELKNSNTISSEIMFYGVHFEKVSLEQGSGNFSYKKIKPCFNSYYMKVASGIFYSGGGINNEY